MRTDEEIIYELHYQSEVERYEKTKSAFDNGDFDYLRTQRGSYVDVREKISIINETEITIVIEELTKINAARLPNEGPILISSDIEYMDQTEESRIVATSYVYTLRPMKSCEPIAKNYTRMDMFKLNKHPNGREAKKLRELIERKRLTDEG